MGVVVEASVPMEVGVLTASLSIESLRSLARCSSLSGPRVRDTPFPWLMETDDEVGVVMVRVRCEGVIES